MRQSNNREQKRPLRPGDLVLIVLVLALAAGIALPFLLAPTTSLYCEVQQNGATIRRIKLAPGYSETFVVHRQNGMENTVEIRGEAVRISEANCPDQVCVRTGWIRHAGQATVCLPNRLVVKLVSAKPGKDNIDAVVQ